MKRGIPVPFRHGSNFYCIAAVVLASLSSLLHSVLVQVYRFPLVPGLSSQHYLKSLFSQLHPPLPLNTTPSRFWRIHKARALTRKTRYLTAARQNNFVVCPNAKSTWRRKKQHQLQYVWDRKYNRNSYQVYVTLCPGCVWAADVARVS